MIRNFIVYILCIASIVGYAQNTDVISVIRNSGHSNTIKYSDIESINIKNDLSNNNFIQVITTKAGNHITIPLAEIDSVIFNNEVNRTRPILFSNLPFGWSTMAYLNSSNFICFKNDSENNHLSAMGLCGSSCTHVKYDDLNRIKRYYDGSISLTLDYSAYDEGTSNDIGVYYENHRENKFIPFIIDILKSNVQNSRSHIYRSNAQQTNVQVLSGLINELLSILTEPIDFLIKPIETFRLIYETDNMGHDEKIDYILNGEYGIIPTDWIDDALNNFNNTPEPDVAPSFYIVIRTGEKSNITQNSAKLYIDGTIQANANDGEFSFEYGIVYSTNPNVDCLNGTHISSNYSSDCSISITLPQPFIARGLKSGTTYYYRAFWRNNNNLSMVDYGKVKSFTTTEEDDALIYGTWSCVWYETPPNAKLLTMTLNENRTMSQTYYYANKGANVTYSCTFDYTGNTLVFYKDNGDTQYWDVSSLDEHNLIITAKDNGFKYYFKR